MRATIIGLGLIGGSLARDLRRLQLADKIFGVEKSSANAALALKIGLVDEVLELSDAIAQSDLVVLAVPVNAIVQLLPLLLDTLPEKAVVFDMGSTKLPLIAAVGAHPRRGRYVAMHPMAGNEHCGPDAAIAGLFSGKVAIICNEEESDADAVATTERLLRRLEMRVVRLDAAFHDRMAAMLSHMPHLLSYALALTALQDARDAGGAILSLAGGGFASMVRIAQSPPSMWTPILLQNRESVLTALDTYNAQLQTLRAAVAAGDAKQLDTLINDANKICNALVASKDRRPED